MLTRLLIATLAVLALVAAPSSAQSEQPRLFESFEAGVSLTLPPGDASTIGSPRPPSDPEALAVVTDAEKEWRFELRRVNLDRPVPLRPKDLPEGGQQPGLLQISVNELQGRVNGDVLRVGLAPLPDADAGRFAVRYSLGPSTLLRQDAIIRASDTLYYRMHLVSPAPQGEADEIGNDPRVAEAVAAFNDAFNSFRLIDQSGLREEQEERLLRTRAMLVNLKPRGRLGAAAAGEQWWIVKNNGSPVGFARVIEESANQLPIEVIKAFESPEARPGAAEPVLAEGVRVGVRLRLRTEEGQIIDRASWSYADRNLGGEDFREVNLLRTPAVEEAEDETNAPPPVEQQGLVIGQMRSQTMPVRRQLQGAPGLGNEVTFELETRRELEVTFTVDGHVVGDSLERQLPAFYVPVAVDHLLPRLLATWGSEQYMVAVYAPDRREVYSKYLDVADVAEVKLPAGGTGKAIVVSARLGYAGQPTEHYIDPGTFAWLGSKTPGSATAVYPASLEVVAETFRGDPLWDELQASTEEVAGE